MDLDFFSTTPFKPHPKSRSKKITAILAFLILLAMILANTLLPLNKNRASAATNTWDMGTSADYSYDSAKIQVSSGTAELKAGGVPGSTWIADEASLSWKYRKDIVIDNSAGGSALSSYQISLTLDTAALISSSKLQSSCADLRFASTDKTTLLTYWIESGCNSTATKIWLIGPTVAAGQTATIYLYYNNALASAASVDPSTITTQKLWLKAESGAKANGAALFTSGTKEYLQITDASQTNLDPGVSDFAFALWAKPTNFSALSSLIGKGATSDSNPGYWLQLTTAAKLDLRFGDGTASRILITPNNTLTAGSWAFVVANFDRDGAAELFLNGASIGTATINTQAGALDTTSNFRLGADPATTPSGFFNGALDSVGLWKRTLTSAEIAALYNSGNGEAHSDLSTSDKTNLVSWWDLNEESGARFDIHGSNHLTNSATQLINSSTLNGGFETAGAGGADVFGSWTETVGDGTIVDETTAVYAGSHAAKLTAGATGSGFVYQNVTATAGSSFTFSFYTRGDGTNAGRYYVWDNTNATYIITSTSTGVSGTSYALVTVNFTVPATCAAFSVRLRQPSVNGGVAYYDNVTLVSNGPIYTPGLAEQSAGYTSYAAQFTSSSSEFLSISDAAQSNLDPGTSDFSTAFWLYLDSLPSGSNLMIPLYKGALNDSTAGYQVRIDASGNVIAMIGNGTSRVSAGNKTVTLNSWNFISANFDRDGNLDVFVNNVAAGSSSISAFSASDINPSVNFNLGMDTGNYLNGRLDNVGFWRRLLTTAERASLLNGGKGKAYADLAAAEKTSLVSYWNMDEASAERADSYTSNNLTDNNTVTQGRGLDYYGRVISKWSDQSGNSNNPAQTTAGKRPAYINSIQNTLPVIRFDGSDDYLQKTFSLSQPLTIIAAAKSTTAGGKVWDGGNAVVNLDRSGASSTWATNAGSALGSGITSNNDMHILAGVYNTTTSRLSVDGTAGSEGNAGANNPGGITLGADNAAANLLNGDIAEILIYNSALSTADRSKVERYLSAKYGITIAGITNSALSPAVGSSETILYADDNPKLTLANTQGFNTVSGFAVSLGSNSSGNIKFQISFNSGSSWYYYSSGWTAAADSYTQSNSASEIAANLSAFNTLAGSGNKYFLWRAYFNSNGIQNPKLDAVAVTYIWDSQAPSNPAAAAFASSSDATVLTTNTWYPYPNPYFSWSAPSDNADLVGGEVASGTTGYYLYFGTDSTADPLTAGAWQTAAVYNSTAVLTSGSAYYLIIKTKDTAGNISAAETLFIYKFDSTAPAPPEYINISPVGCSTLNSFTLTWPAVADAESGIANYEYKVASTGTTQTTTELSVTVAPYQEGENIFYLRGRDIAGNTSTWQTAVFCSTGVAQVIDGPTVSAGPSSMTIKWTSSKPTTGYVKVNQGNTYVSEQGHTEYVINHSVKILGLRSEQIYRYRLTWVDQSGNIGESNWYETNTNTTPGIKDLKAEILSPSKVLVSWQTNYTATNSLEYGIGNYSTTLNLEGEGTNFSKQLENLTAGANYQLRVKAYTATDNTEFAGLTSFSTPPLPQISNIRFDYIPGASPTIRLSWTTNVDSTSIVNYKGSCPLGEGCPSELSVSAADMTREHSLEIKDLSDNTTYEFTAKSMDKYGNYAVSEKQKYETPFDTRSPKIKNMTVEIKSSGFGETQKAQLVVSWETDEPATSQIEYGPGITSTSYSFRTKEDSTLATNHVVIASDLEPSKIYHLRALSQDKAQNAGLSEDTTVITGKIQKSVLDIILNSLERSLGWIFKMFR